MLPSAQFNILFFFILYSPLYQVVCLREAERHLHLRCEELELHAGEQEVVLREMEAAMQRLVLDADRRLTQQHKDHQSNIQLLLQKLKGDWIRSAWTQQVEIKHFPIPLHYINAKIVYEVLLMNLLFCLLVLVCVCIESVSGEAQEAKGDRLQHLEKELFFYKSTSRQLKMKLKELLSDAVHPDGQSLHPQEHRHVYNMQIHAGANESPAHPEKVQTSTHISTTYTKIHAEQTDRKTHSYENRNAAHPQCSSSTSDRQALKKTKTHEYNQIQAQGRSVSSSSGECLEMTPVRVCRRELRQISAADLQVSGSATRRRQSVVDTSTESMVEDSIEVSRNGDR